MSSLVALRVLVGFLNFLSDFLNTGNKGSNIPADHR